MDRAISAPLFAAFVARFVRESSEIGGLKAFSRTRIAEEVYGRKIHAKAYFSKLCSPPLGRHPSPSHVDLALNACRELLREQIKQIGSPNPDARVREFEVEVCQSLGLPTTRSVISNDFLLDSVFESAWTPEEFGVPDIMSWSDGTLGFIDEVERYQNRSIEVMRHILGRVTRTHDIQRRLQLLYVACSISALNYPGSRWHEEAYQGTVKIAASSGLLELLYQSHVSPDLRWLALCRSMDLSSLTFMPTLDSPANVMLQAIRNQRISQEFSRDIQQSVQRTLFATEQLVEIDPESEYAHLNRAAFLSQHARILAAQNRFREADQVYKSSLRHAERCLYTTLYLYPIQRAVLAGHMRKALSTCEWAVSDLKQSRNDPATFAFSALFLQLSSLANGKPTTDCHYREMARRAIRSPSDRYQFSHVFDTPTVRALLRERRPR